MKKENLNFKVIGFWIVMLLITVIFAIVFVNKITKVTTFDSMKDVDRAGLNISGSITSQSDSKYFVYIYSSEKESPKKTELEPSIFSYFTYVAKNNNKSGIVPIYAYDVENYKALPGYETVGSYLETLNKNIVVGDTPLLIEISSASVSNTYKTANDIEKILQSQRNQK